MVMLLNRVTSNSLPKVITGQRLKEVSKLATWVSGRTFWVKKKKEQSSLKQEVPVTSDELQGDHCIKGLSRGQCGT